MLAATTTSQLMRHYVYHLPGGCPSYVRGRAVIIGDAAHAMPPTIGQGAATALEDGVCVGRMIASPVSADGDLAGALAAFDQGRRQLSRQMFVSRHTVQDHLKSIFAKTSAHNRRPLLSRALGT